MKVELTKDCGIKITAETITEAWALNMVYPAGANPCGCCGTVPYKLVVDCAILLPKEGEQIG